MRLFVGIELPDRLTASLADPLRDLEGIDGVSTVDPDGAHLTLSFLGETDPARVPALERALETAVAAAGSEPFSVTFEGVGAFPRRAFPRVVWVGVSTGGEELSRMQAAIDEALTSGGFEPSSHDEFIPHVTLARVRDREAHGVVRSFLEDADPFVGTMTVDRIAVIESTVTPSGSRYETVSTVRLGECP